MMQEVEDAIRAVRSATNTLEGILKLPTTQHAEVQWQHNGCLWVRISDDVWRSRDPRGELSILRFSSAHVAGFPWIYPERALSAPSGTTGSEQP